MIKAQCVEVRMIKLSLKHNAGRLERFNYDKAQCGVVG